MSIAEEFRDHVIYFPYNMDFRGRTYPIPPNLNILGSDFSRGVLVFDEARPLGEKGLYWLKVAWRPRRMKNALFSGNILPFTKALTQFGNKGDRVTW